MVFVGRMDLLLLLVAAFIGVAVRADDVTAHTIAVTLTPLLSRLGTSSAPLPAGLVVIPHPIQVAEPAVPEEELEERQDTVIRQTSSSGKLQHILRAHFVGRIENEQRFETQSALEPAPLPRSPQVSLNDAFFREQETVVASSSVAPVTITGPVTVAAPVTVASSVTVAVPVARPVTVGVPVARPVTVALPAWQYPGYAPFGSGLWPSGYSYRQLPAVAGRR